jgi:predicted RNA-binding Zn-ribbon protein involved in translation (DUF1610 family)
MALPGDMQYRGHTVSPVEFMQQYLGDHDTTCPECGYEAPMRSDWNVEKHDDHGVHFHHICPECDAVVDIKLRPDD